MKNEHNLSSWIDPVTYEQMGELLVNPDSQQNEDLSPDEWWEKLKQTQDAIDSASSEPTTSSTESESIAPKVSTTPQGVASPVTQRQEEVPRSAISSIRQKLDSLEPKPSTHQKSPAPDQSAAEPEEKTDDGQKSEPTKPAPPAHTPISPNLKKLQLPKPQPKPHTQQVSVKQVSSDNSEISEDQTQRALDRFNEWVTDYLSFANACLINETGDILTGHHFDSSFTTAASTLGNAFLKATQFQLEDADPEDEIHQFPHRAAHTPWEDQYLTVIPVNTLDGLYIVAGLTSESIDRRKACMAAETLLRVTGAPKS